MTGKSEAREINAVDAHPSGLQARLASRLVPPIAAGRLVVEFSSGACIERVGRKPGPDVRIRLHRWRALIRFVVGGQVGFASSYLDGDWSTSDLVRLFELFMLNEECLQPPPSATLAARILARLRHGLHKNTRRGSKRNIAEHYDLGNNFYAPWLDRGMTYSAAMFDGNETLEEAQENKIRRVADFLELEGGERVLEIGCGWGALAEHLVRRRGCHVTGITLSQEQFSYACDRLRPEIGLGAAELRLQDYRDVDGRFDRIVAVEMFEAVGEAYWRIYFDALRQRLVHGGTAVLQVITIAEERFQRYKSSPDFIQRYIFPGGMLPTKAHLHELAANAGLSVTSEIAFGHGYARTLAEWRMRFRQAWPRLEPFGFDERFRRMWEYYLSYCEVGFNVNATDVVLLQLKAPN
ncbi:cyclopropane-fatty-acyl-phospholipid synthase family protein [Mesorhizobium sp. KR9-304]|uniref:cyclopropane-fatty-acyl-phospholipid synthase family protein n=1 Tax=Mesorhizobium sp. KR9-304 TaxID=3156614 RepID=UPI0032B5ACAF